MIVFLLLSFFLIILVDAQFFILPPGFIEVRSNGEALAFQSFAASLGCD